MLEVTNKMAFCISMWIEEKKTSCWTIRYLDTMFDTRRKNEWIFNKLSLLCGFCLIDEIWDQRKRTSFTRRQIYFGISRLSPENIETFFSFPFESADQEFFFSINLLLIESRIINEISLVSNLLFWKTDWKVNLKDKVWAAFSWRDFRWKIDERSRMFPSEDERSIFSQRLLNVETSDVEILEFSLVDGRRNEAFFCSSL